MKKAILILSTLLVASVFYYNYKSEQLLSRAQAHEKIKDYERALDYYENYSEITNNNVVFAEKLYDIAKIQIEIKDYENAEKNLNHFKNLELSGGWLNSEVDSNEINHNNYKKRSLRKQYIEIYENTNREQLALKLLRGNEEFYFKGGCIIDVFERGIYYVSKVFDLSYKLADFETALEVVFKNRIFSSKAGSTKLKKVIEWKMNQYSDAQQDSIIQSAYDSIKFEISTDDSSAYFTMSYQIFDVEIPGKPSPRRLIELDSNINATDTNKIMDMARKEFEKSWIYKVLVETIN